MVQSIRKQLQSIFQITRRIRGNARTILITEPMWAVPYNLFTSYFSLYMLALGCTKRQVGEVVSIGFAAGMVFSLLSGPITDRLGRKKTTFIFDMISWSIPTLLWAFARDYSWFVAAAVLNSVVRIVFTSWSCILVEDTEPGMRVYAFSGLYLANIVAGFIAPLGGLLVRRFTVVGAMRGLFLFSFFAMTAMFIIRNSMLRETALGMQRMQAVKSARAGQLFKNLSGAAIASAHNLPALLALLMVIFNLVQVTLRATFFPVLLAGELRFQPYVVALFPSVYSAAMLAAYFLLMPSVGRMRIHVSLSLAAVLLIGSNLLLLFSPPRSYLVVTLSTVTGAVGAAMCNPLLDSLLANSIPDQERANVLSVFYVLQLALSTPFGWLSGWLSSISDRLPFVLALGSAVANLLLVWLFVIASARKSPLARI